MKIISTKRAFISISSLQLNFVYEKTQFSADQPSCRKRLQQAAAAVQELDGIGLSLIEISHCSKEFVAIMEEAQQLALRLLGVENKGYRPCFTRWCHLQFLMVAYNLLEHKAGYLTGTWSTKAIKEAQLFGKVEELTSRKTKILATSLKTMPFPATRLHSPNNQQHYIWDAIMICQKQWPLVADMVRYFLLLTTANLIYSMLEHKNMGPAGTTLVVVKESILGKVSRSIPAMPIIGCSIDSMFNTPVFAVYTSFQYALG